MKICLLLGGIADRSATGLQRLTPMLEGVGYRVYPILYGWFFLRGLLWHPFHLPLARLITAFTRILQDCGQQVVCIAHSNGCALAAKASELGAYFEALVFVNAAAERNIRLGERTGLLINCHVPSDPALAVARVIAPLSPWAALDGSLGNAGVKAGADARMWDIDLTAFFGITGHGGFVAEENVARTGPWLVKSLAWATQPDVYKDATAYARR